MLPGGLATLYLNGTGDVNWALLTGEYTPATPVYTPFAPITVTVGGQPALLQYAALAPLSIGTAQINFYIPAGLAPGPQPVVVTVGDASSAPVNVTVAAPPPTTKQN